MRLRKFLAMLAAAALVLGGCGAGESKSFTVTFFTDVHHGDHNYNDFLCTEARTKLRAILNETPDTDFYINLGDVVDYLKNGKTTFMDEVMDVFEEFNLPVAKAEGEGRRVYNSMGNHEAAFMAKKELEPYIPYVEGVGSVYAFENMGVLFVAVDGNFERESKSDEPSILKTTTKFIIPKNQIDYLKDLVEEKMHSGISTIVWFSHIAFKDLENKSRWELVDIMAAYNKPFYIFEGHTHVQNHQVWTDDYDDSKIIVEIYTLPAVTSGVGYRYYNVTFKDGLLQNIDMHTDGTIEAEL